MGIIDGGEVIAGGTVQPDSGHPARPLTWDGVPVDGVSGSYAGQIAVGGLVQDTNTGHVYENQGTQASPTYVRVDTIPV